MAILVDARIDDERTDKLFAWLCKAFTGDMRYNNLMFAFAACFADASEDAPGADLVAEALAELPQENAPAGDSVSLREREEGSLGAMGAGQWTGQFRTRPHALLDVRSFESVDDWVKSLSRGQRRTLAKANGNGKEGVRVDESDSAGSVPSSNAPSSSTDAPLPPGAFTVARRSIRGNQPAPHSTLAHFRCVVEHELRLLADTPEDFFDALSQAIGRYRNCVNQAGEILEYRDARTGRVLAFAQEATKGRVRRGQWFYATDAASERYVWFHSVQELVRRSIADPEVDYADLGPSGTDAFSVLKAKYGFTSVADWHTVADYRGPFRYAWGQGESWADLDPPDWLFEERSGPAGVLDRVLAEMDRRL